MFSTACTETDAVRDSSGDAVFIAADILGALSLDRKALERLDPDEKGVSSIHTPGGEQEMTVVTEAGLYNLVLGSRKREAKRFQRWVRHEVLPAIRKTGTYSVSATIHEDYVATLSGDFKTFREAGMSEQMALFVANSLAAQKTGVAPLPQFPVSLPNPARMMPARIAAPINEADAFDLVTSLRVGETVLLEDFVEFGYSTQDALRRSIRAFAKRKQISVSTVASPSGILVSRN